MSMKNSVFKHRVFAYFITHYAVNVVQVSDRQLMLHAQFISLGRFLARFSYSRAKRACNLESVRNSNLRVIISDWR